MAHGIRQDLARYRIVRGSVSRGKIRSAVHMWEVYRTIEKLNPIDAAWCFAHYAWRASTKGVF